MGVVQVTVQNGWMHPEGPQRLIEWRCHRQVAVQGGARCAVCTHEAPTGMLAQGCAHIARSDAASTPAKHLLRPCAPLLNLVCAGTFTRLPSRPSCPCRTCPMAMVASCAPPPRRSRRAPRPRVWWRPPSGMCLTARCAMGPMRCASLCVLSPAWCLMRCGTPSTASRYGAA